MRIVAIRCKPNLGVGTEKLLKLRARAQSRVVHIDRHPEDDHALKIQPPKTRSGSFLSGMTRFVQAHSTLDKAPN
jgi:hypothetical protein